MSPTVHEVRNTIRTSVGRFEREVNTQFTKEELVAICNELNCFADGGSPPSKTAMRAAIRRNVGLSETEAEASGGAFSKAELQAIADELTGRKG
jgi:hypothetical protein